MGTARHTTTTAAEVMARTGGKTAAHNPDVEDHNPLDDKQIPEGFEGFDIVESLTVSGFWDGREEGATIQGYLEGSIERPSNLNRNTKERIYWLRLDQPCKIIDKDKREVQGKVGDTVGVNGRGNINQKLLPQVRIAAETPVLVRIRCEGQNIRTSAGNEMYDYTVGIRASSQRAAPSDNNGDALPWVRALAPTVITAMTREKCNV